MTNKIFYIFLTLVVSGVAFWYFSYYQKGFHGKFEPQNQKLIVFDFDGTLCDSLGFAISEFNKLCQDSDLKPIDNLDALRNMPLQQFLELHGVTRYKLPLVKYRLVKAIAKHILDMASFQDACVTLLELKKHGYMLGILTSNSYENVETFLKKENLLVFDFIYCNSSLFGKAKLLKEIQYKTKPSVMFYVGDENRDIEAANKANIASVAVNWGYQSEVLLSEYHPSYLVKSMQELLAVFNIKI